MKENNKIFDKVIFGLEFTLSLVIPFIIWWATTPTKVLNSHLLFRLLETIGICGSGLIFFAGIPVGIIGIIMAKRMTELRKATIALSVINLVAGSIEVFIVIAIFYLVIFRGASV